MNKIISAVLDLASMYAPDEVGRTSCLKVGLARKDSIKETIFRAIE
jgi:hypothetical protein